MSRLPLHDGISGPSVSMLSLADPGYIGVLATQSIRIATPEGRH
jgi:hypothetical protein